MTEEHYHIFVKDHKDEIIAKIRELDNFDYTDIGFLKCQIVRGINIRKKMPVVPLFEIRQLLVGYAAIKFLEDELNFKF
ncbi:MAG: hypothetical protein GY754_06275 [bacterium]|nr:hypothetical protein [bacterium]